MIHIIPDSEKLKEIATRSVQSILLRIARETIRNVRASTIKAKGPSPPGTPPHEHFGDLDRSLAAAIDDNGNVIFGPRESIVGERGSVLEFAGTYVSAAARNEAGQFLTGHASRTAPSGARWARPFMRPAMEQAIAAGSFESGNQISSSFT